MSHILSSRPPAARTALVQEMWRGEGTVEFHKARWEGMPTQYGVLNAFAGLEMEYRGATITRSVGGKDPSDQRILRHLLYSMTRARRGPPASGTFMADPMAGLTTALADRYEIELGPDGQPLLLGQGGMATVYRALDLKHHRKVALKLLRPNVAAVVGAERFLHKIQVTAGLQHPHILPLHDSGIVRLEPNGPALPYYVMPLVEGESLRQALAREIQLPLEAVLTITKGVASALDYAHRHGVIHRDIKPENILLHEGQAVVADFGIALALSTAGGTRLTDTGLALGTPQYMSPEQAVGQRELTARSDVYALGCVVYEMLAGEPPFTGPTAQAIAAKAARDTPQPLRVGRPSVPVQVDAAVSRALARLPADRFGTAGELVQALEAGVHVTTPVPGLEPVPVVARPSRMRRVAGVAGLLALGIGAGIGLWAALHRPAPEPSIRFTLELSPGLNPDVPFNRIALSLDGSALVYVGGRAKDSRLYLRFLDRLESTPLPGTDGALIPFFSPDGRSVGFFADGSLQQVPLSGGAPAVISKVEGSISGASWGSNDVVVFASSTTHGLWRVAATGGKPEVLIRPLSDETAQAAPHVLPGGKAVAFATSRGIELASLETGKVTRILDGDSPRYISTGHLLFHSNGSLAAVPFDLAKLRPTGASIRFTESARARSGSAYEFEVADNGLLVYGPGQGVTRDLTIVDRTGREQRIAGNSGAGYFMPRWSPDGRRLAFERAQGIWVYDLSRGMMSRLTVNEGYSSSPVWTPDGRRITFMCTRANVEYICWKPFDGSGPTEPLPHTAQLYPMAWSPDGTLLIAAGGSPADLWVVWADSTKPPRRLTETPFHEFEASISPDGRWLAYTSNESGRFEVYVQPLLGSGARWQVSSGGGQGPDWSPTGRELFYVSSDDSLTAVAIEPGSSFAMGARKGLFRMSSAAAHVPKSYDIHPDGQRFVVGAQRTGLDRLIVVTNWFEELRKPK